LQKTATERQKVSLEDISVFSQDARKLQETEVILQNALDKLREMDEITEKNLQGIKERIDNDYYNNNEVNRKIVNDLFPEKELRRTVERRMKADSYLPELKKLDDLENIDEAKLNKVRDRIDNGFYASRQVYDRVADDLLSVLEG